MSEWTCEDCGKEYVILVHGMNAIKERGCWWCGNCAPIGFIDGKPYLREFPAKGKLIPSTIMTPDKDREP